MRMFLKQIIADSAGATAVEYGLILAMIFLAMVAGVQSTGNAVGNVWGEVTSKSDAAIKQASV